MDSIIITVDASEYELSFTSILHDAHDTIPAPAPTCPPPASNVFFGLFSSPSVAPCVESTLFSDL